MKIAMAVGPGGPRSAASDHGRWLPDLLSAAGHDVIVYVLDGARNGETRSHIVNLTVDAGDVAAALQTRFDRDRPDLVQAHAWPVGLYAQLAADRCELPIVQSFHGTAPIGARAGMAGPAQAQLAAMVARTATWVTAGSNQELEAVARLRRSRMNASVITGGIDAHLIPTPPARGNVRTTQLIIGLAGTTDLDPGFDLVVHALAKIGGDTRFAGFARPAQRAHVDGSAKLARALGLQDRVTFEVLDTSEDLAARLAQADIVTCTPRSCTDDSATVLQAMAAGIPLVATDIGLLSDLIIDDITGVLIAPDQSTALVNALKMLLTQPFRRHSMGAAGRSRASGRYNWQRIAQEYEWVYERTMASAMSTAKPSLR